MRNRLGAAIVVIATLCALGLGPAAQARAECTTQGALALSLADLLKFNVTTTEGAAAALTAIEIKPDAGWDLPACLTPEVTAQVQAAYAAAVAAGGRWGRLAAGGFEAAIEALKPIDRQYPHVELSPFRP
jgi:hypothetical protein